MSGFWDSISLLILKSSLHLLPSYSKYAAITALSVRQALATIEITVPFDKDTGTYLKNDTLIFLKEISSNGDMSTVDGEFGSLPS